MLGLEKRLPQYQNNFKPNSQLNGENIKKELKNLHGCRDAANNKYLKIIQELELMVESLLQKNDFLMKDRSLLLRENHSLRMKCQSLSAVLEMKKRLMIEEEEDLFTILIQNKVLNSAEPMENQNPHAFEDSRSERNQLLISNNPLSFEGSQQSQISLSNINIRNQTMLLRNVQTPGLPHENIYIQCSSLRSEGVIRSFYLCLIQNKVLAKMLAKSIHYLREDHTVVIFEPYPTNEFWVDLLAKFLQLVYQGKFEGQYQLLDYLKVHRLIDTLLVKSLKSRVQFLFSGEAEGQGPPEITELFAALANQFSLRMELQDGQFLFFIKEFKDDNMLLSDKVSLQISLNHKQQSKYYVREEEPCFIIFYDNDLLQFKFFVPLQHQMALSQYQIQQNIIRPNSFSLSEEKDDQNSNYNESFAQNRVQDEFDGVSNILNERDINIFEQNDNLILRNMNKKYNQTQMLYCQGQGKDPLKSSRFFLNRVSSQNSIMAFRND